MVDVINFALPSEYAHRGWCIRVLIVNLLVFASAKTVDVGTNRWRLSEVREEAISVAEAGEATVADHT